MVWAICEIWGKGQTPSSRKDKSGCQGLARRGIGEVSKAVAPHSSTLAWKIPWTEEPGRLQSMGSLSRTWLSNFTFTFHFHALEKEMATHSSVLAWRIPGMGEPGGLRSMRSHRVGHDWSNLAAAAKRYKLSVIERIWSEDPTYFRVTIEITLYCTTEICWESRT